jgi:hypothetical protein
MNCFACKQNLLNRLQGEVAVAFVNAAQFSGKEMGCISLFCIKRQNSAILQQEILFLALEISLDIHGK